MQRTSTIDQRRLRLGPCLPVVLLALPLLPPPALAQDTLFAVAGPPRYNVGAGPPSPSFRYVVFVNGVRITAEFYGLAAQKMSPPPETNAQASQRKAKAIVDALNASIAAAIADGKLPAGTAMAVLGTAPATVPNVDRNGNPIPGQPATKPNVQAGYGTITLPGFTGFADPKDKDGSRDPTGEPRGEAIRRPGAGSAAGVKAAMGGTGFGTGLATGLDPDGSPSFVSFGVYEPRGLNEECATGFPPVSPCEGFYAATLFPTAGMDDAQVLGGLSALFNSLYAPYGFTSSYDPLTDLLSLDQPINNYLTLFTQNTDPGLDLDPFLSFTVPESAPISLLGIGLLGLALFRRRARGNQAH